MRRSSTPTAGIFDEQQAAWQLHVELATRIAVAPLPQDQGLLGEAIASLDVLAARAREVLREHGPHELAADGFCSFAIAAGEVTDGIVGPLLRRWKPRLAAWTATAGVGAGQVHVERSWPQNSLLRQELEQARVRLTDVANRLAELAGARSLVVADRAES